MLLFSLIIYIEGSHSIRHTHQRSFNWLFLDVLMAAENRGSPRYRKETHGRGEDIDPDTPISEFKGPNIFHRAKEEIEAIRDTIHSKRESASPKKQSSLSGTSETKSTCFL
ncbi:hypothetical protein HanHA300_Chr06g0213311 [Helianthus annuus]|nr:hypothetical protein HanHA300_Chr06g0213311 [Helianthus annuus]